MRSKPPIATYRLQFNSKFTFRDACHIIPYLNQLGFSHVYASPLLKARTASKHGYDIVDHNALNPEIGDEADFTKFVDTLHQYDMGLILDIVPNHMGVGGDDNIWWLDVLEHGEASEYAAYFDIDWHPPIPGLRNKVLLPFLADHYGTVLEQGELSLILNTSTGEFGVRYYQHYFPLDPKTYGTLLSYRMETLSNVIGGHEKSLVSFQRLILDFQNLPKRTELSTSQKKKRKKNAQDCKLRLAELCEHNPLIKSFLVKNTRVINGEINNPRSHDLFHKILESQAYRLAYWKVASDEINYRRFFDINELAGIRIDKFEVFEATHSYINHLIGEGKVDGLRIDHPDGLSDPYEYFYTLQNKIRQNKTENNTLSDDPFYILIEKILSTGETLPADWPISGTTGYETAHLINGLFVYPYSEKSLTRIYEKFTGLKQDFNQLLYELKKLIIQNLLASELVILANLATAIAKSNRISQDFTYHGLRKAIIEIAACFPVYRTYVTPHHIGKEDDQSISFAIEKAKRINLVSDIKIFDFLGDLLKLNDLNQNNKRTRIKKIQFATRFQQYTAPVMAKGMEDTFFYVYNRLISLNDVGFNPRLFGTSSSRFHHQNRLRQKSWPHNLVGLSTHDSKRSEDIRARISVISEIPRQWSRHLTYWTRINQSNKTIIDNIYAPSRNDEYLFYQTLLGSWPLAPTNTVEFSNFRERIEKYMIKAIKEAKTHTSWLSLDNEYENATRKFIRAALNQSSENAFLEDFIPFQACLTRLGLLSGLSQTLLRLTIPGIPDFYQGTEIWAFNLVDPDNRRLVDYSYRKLMLASMVRTFNPIADDNFIFNDMLEHIEDGRAKLFLIWKTLTLRRHMPRVFVQGNYLALKIKGKHVEHICAFIRQRHEDMVLVAVSRWFAILATESNSDFPESASFNPLIWEDTWIRLPEMTTNSAYRNALTGHAIEACQQEDGLWLNVAELYRDFPVALLVL